ncbi:MAG: hypothetical protein QG577_2778 [Thermodesulfobacteriota bacterium]|nr:hypothetical protein [Thermodesulfobacteriota bacterium]
MKIDLHCHSYYSQDNRLDPRVVIARAIQLGLNGVCFTEHYSVDVSWPVEQIDTPEDFVVLRGVEISTDLGHVLVYGVKDDGWNQWGRNTFLEFHKIAESVHEIGGLCVPAHPFRGWESVGEKIYSMGNIDAVETHNGVNGPAQNRLAQEAQIKLAMPSIGGSDCHYPHQIGQAYTEFENLVTNVDDLVREIAAARCKGCNLGAS